MKGKFAATLFHALLLFGLLLAGSQNASSGTAIELSPKPDLYIISVGIDEYQSKEFKLRFAKADAVSIADEFEKRGKETFETIKKVVLLDNQATKSGIVNAFETIARDAQPDDVFIFNFAGIGGTHYKELKEFHIVTADAKRENLEESGISSGQLQALFRKIRATTKLVILDSCDSSVGYESAAASFAEQDKNAASLIDENILIIGTDASTPEDATLGHGVMTAIVLDGLKGDADCNGDGIVTNYELMVQMYNGGAKDDKKNFKFSPRTIARGKIFNLGYTDKKLEEVVAKEKQAKEKQNQTASSDAPGDAKKGDPTRSGAVNLKGEKPSSEDVRKGEDYALLFANDAYDNAGWSNLKNPRNDANDVAKELKERYGFKEVTIKSNLTTQEIYATIETYQNFEFKNAADDQLFIFFAGHGETGKYNKGFYVGKDSPQPLTQQNESQFVALDTLLTGIDLIPLQHIMVVFDACYAGTAWKPTVQLIQETAFSPNKTDEVLTADLIVPYKRNVGKSGFDFSEDENWFSEKTQISRLAYAKRKMKKRSRIILTSGDKPVADAWRKEDGSLSNNSPFADAFLQALRTDGGSDRVLITGEIVPFIDKLDVEPQKGRLSGSDGDFVFVLPDKR